MSSYLLYYFHLANRRRKLCKLIITVFDNEFKQKVTGVLGNQVLFNSAGGCKQAETQHLSMRKILSCNFFVSQEGESGPSDPTGSISIIFFAIFSRPKRNQGPVIGILIESVVSMSRS